MSTRYTPASLFAIIAIATILFISTCTAAFEFDLDARSYKCFREELPTNFDVYGEIEAFHGYGQTIDFRVTDPSGRVLVDKKDVNKVDFNFVATHGGEYSLCFFNKMLPGVSYHAGLARRVNFDVLTGTETFDYENLAKKEDLKPVEVNLRMMEDIVKSIHSQYVYFRNRANAFGHTTESTHARVQWLGALCILLGIASGASQIYYLRRYFIRKKLV